MDIPSLARSNPAWASRAVVDVLAERERQRAKGYDAKHDDGHTVTELANAGAGFALCATANSRMPFQAKLDLFHWNFAPKLVTLRTRDLLVRGAAMLLAAIERYDRAQALELLRNREEAANVEWPPSAGLEKAWVDPDSGEQRVTPRPAPHKRPPPIAEQAKIRHCKFNPNNEHPCEKCGAFRSGMQCEDIDGAME